MAKQISNVIVDKISILSKKNTPAVQWATFKLFKMFSKNKISDELKKRLEKLQKSL